jgi:hypothetical protein
MQGRYNTTPVFICYFYLALSQSKFQSIVCYANACGSVQYHRLLISSGFVAMGTRGMLGSRIKSPLNTINKQITEPRIYPTEQNFT